MKVIAFYKVGKRLHQLSTVEINKCHIVANAWENRCLDGCFLLLMYFPLVVIRTYQAPSLYHMLISTLYSHNQESQGWNDGLCIMLVD